MRIIALLFVMSTFICAQDMSDYKLKDGRIYDKGFQMKEMSPDSPEELEKLEGLIGNWEVNIKSRTSDSTFSESKAYSRFTFLNRGYSIMEKFYCSDFNGNGDELNTLSFIAFNGNNKTWNIGVADSYKESIMLFTGKDSDDNLILYNSYRKNGQLNIYTYRYSIKNISETSFDIATEFSLNETNTWELAEERNYNKAMGDFKISFENDSFGAYNEKLPEEAREFDFLIGEWDAHHEILSQTGDYIKYSSNATAVYALNGNAVLEHDWFNAKRGMKDPGTSLLRVYNRAARRWECLFLTNRNNSIYYFGGVKEGDDIILHSFDTDASAPGYSYYVFYNISENDYSWRGKRTTDRGETFVDTWRIEVDKKVK